MKKQLIFTSLLVIPALGFLATKNDQIIPPVKELNKANFFCCSGLKDKAETTWNQESKIRTGRQLTYLWAEQTETQTLL